MVALKTVAIDFRDIIGIDGRLDGISIHSEGKEVVESFKIDNSLKLTYFEWKTLHRAVFWYDFRTNSKPSNDETPRSARRIGRVRSIW